MTKQKEKKRGRGLGGKWGLASMASTLTIQARLFTSLGRGLAVSVLLGTRDDCAKSPRGCISAAFARQVDREADSSSYSYTTLHSCMHASQPSHRLTTIVSTPTDQQASAGRHNPACPRCQTNCQSAKCQHPLRPLLSLDHPSYPAILSL